MEETIKIPVIRDYYDIGANIYPYKEVIFEPGVTCLIGCNGSGKSTLLQQIERYCNNNDIACMKLDNYKDGGLNSMSASMFYGDTEGFINDFMSSEGERIINNIGRFASQIGRMAHSMEDGKQIVVLFDAIGSGLSIDNVEKVQKYLFDTIFEDGKKKRFIPYIIVATNEYEFARNSRCFNVATGKIVENPTYTKYRSQIMQSRKRKDNYNLKLSKRNR